MWKKNREKITLNNRMWLCKGVWRVFERMHFFKTDSKRCQALFYKDPQRQRKQEKSH